MRKKVLKPIIILITVLLAIMIGNVQAVNHSMSDKTSENIYDELNQKEELLESANYIVTENYITNVAPKTEYSTFMSKIQDQLEEKREVKVRRHDKKWRYKYN